MKKKAREYKKDLRMEMRARDEKKKKKRIHNK